jgi:hypothetical protein
MGEPCSRDGKLSAIDERTKGHAQAIAGFQIALEGTNRVLGKISEALADIRHLHEDISRNERDITEVFGRIRALEMAPGKAMTRIGWIVLTASSGCAGGIISGVTVWIVKGS